MGHPSTSPVSTHPTERVQISLRVRATDAVTSDPAACLAAHEELWQLVCEAPEIPPAEVGKTFDVGSLRRIYESWADPQKSFSLYQAVTGIVALVAVPETASFRLRFTLNSHPGVPRVLALTSIQPSK
jgi:hypothetical protein